MSSSSLRLSRDVASLGLTRSSSGAVGAVIRRLGEHESSDIKSELNTTTSITPGVVVAQLHVESRTKALLDGLHAGESSKAVLGSDNLPHLMSALARIARDHAGTTLCCAVHPIAPSSRASTVLEALGVQRLCGRHTVKNADMCTTHLRDPFAVRIDATNASRTRRPVADDWAFNLAQSVEYVLALTPDWRSVFARREVDIAIGSSGSGVARAGAAAGSSDSGVAHAGAAASSSGGGVARAEAAAGSSSNKVASAGSCGCAAAHAGAGAGVPAGIHAETMQQLVTAVVLEMQKQTDLRERQDEMRRSDAVPSVESYVMSELLGSTITSALGFSGDLAALCTSPKVLLDEPGKAALHAELSKHTEFDRALAGPLRFFFDACCFQLPAFAAQRPTSLRDTWAVTHTGHEDLFSPFEPAAVQFSWRLSHWSHYLACFDGHHDDILWRWIADHPAAAHLWLEGVARERVTDHACLAVVRHVARRLAAVVREARSMIVRAPFAGTEAHRSFAARVEANACGAVLMRLRDLAATHQLHLSIDASVLQHGTYFEFRRVVLDGVTGVKLVRVGEDEPPSAVAAGAGSSGAASVAAGAAPKSDAALVAELRAENARLKQLLSARPPHKRPRHR